MIYVVEVPARVQGWIGARDGEARSLKDLAERLAADIARTQRRNHRARVAARRRRLRELAALGIDPDRLPLCDVGAL